jgi:uncharacterized membrane protein
MTTIQIEKAEGCTRLYNVSFNNVWQARVRVEDDGTVEVVRGGLDGRTQQAVLSKHRGAK